MMQSSENVDASCQAVKNRKSDQRATVTVDIEENKSAREKVKNAADDGGNDRRNGPDEQDFAENLPIDSFVSVGKKREANH